MFFPLNYQEAFAELFLEKQNYKLTKNELTHTQFHWIFPKNLRAVHLMESSY